MTPDALAVPGGYKAMVRWHDGDHNRLMCVDTVVSKTGRKSARIHSTRSDAISAAKKHIAQVMEAAEDRRRILSRR